MENLNAEQIIKALECCIDGKYYEDCKKCPLHPDKCGTSTIERLALALITSQEQRIGELTEENERLQKALDTDISIVRVSRGSGKTAHLREIGRIRVDAIRADTVRKMQERLKADAITIKDHTGKLGVVVGVGNIDDVAREMLEGDNEN